MQFIIRPLARLLPLAMLALPLALGAPLPAAHADETASTTIYLPLIGTGGVAPDLIFTPDSVSLTPGESANIQVRVEPNADLTGASFELPGVQEGISSSFEAAADGASGTLTIAASASSEAAERPLIVQGQSGLDSSKTWTGALRVTTSATLTAKTIFVDAVSGNDSADGSQSRPLKTLGKALTKVVAGDTVKLAPGGYGSISFISSASDDSFPLNVPVGVTIEGAPGFESTLFGVNGQDGLAFQGDATVKNLNIIRFSIALRASKGKQSLSNILMGPNRTDIGLEGTANTTLKGSTIFVTAGDQGVDIFGQAQFTMDGGKISGGSANCSSGNGLRISNAGQALLKNNALLENVAGRALFMVETAKATLDHAIIRNVFVANCTPGPRVRLEGTTSLTLKSATVTVGDGSTDVAINSIGIQTSGSGNITLVLKDSLINGFSGKGLELPGKGSLVMTGGGVSTGGLTNNGIAIDAPQMPLTITGASLRGGSLSVGTGSAIRARALKLRSSSVESSRIGIEMLNGGNADLGTPNDPGNNTIRNNTITGVAFQDKLNGFGTISAVGNTWKPNTQGADAQGHYTIRQNLDGGFRSDPTTDGLNFSLIGSTQHIKL
jgi:hypothetical protein